jgi:FkbM family methyltransferase
MTGRLEHLSRRGLRRLSARLRPPAAVAQPAAPAVDPELAFMMERDRRDNEALRLALAATLARDAHVIDIGAHHGAVLEDMVRCAPEGRFLAFEPIPELAAALRARFPAVDVHEVALFDAAGESTFAHIADIPAHSGLRLRSLPPGEHDIREITVRTARLDDLLPDGFAPAFIKIDVEGGELGVLRGAVETLRRHKPVIVFEHGIGAAEHYGHTSGELHDLLCGECGMRIYDLAGAGPFSRAEFEALFPEPVWNFLARA